MKRFLVTLCFVGAATVLVLPELRAQTTSAAPATNGDTTASEPSGRHEKMKAVFAQLDLSEAQKAQIKQIRASTSPGKERRQQIMAVLTPDQKAKLVSMIKENRSAAANSAQ